MKLLKDLNLPEEVSSVNMTLRDYGRNFSDLRDAHVRSVILFDLKNQPANHPFQAIFEHFEKLNQTDIQSTEHSMLIEQNEFLALKNVLENNDQLDQYFTLNNPDPQKILEVFGLSYLKSFNAFNTSIKNLDPILLHEWRKRLKDVQFQFELLYDHLNSDIQKQYQNIQDLCTVLGELNDMDMIHRWMTNNQPELTGKDKLSSLLFKEVSKQQKLLLSVARSDGLKLYTYTPDQFKDQLF